MPCPRTSSQRSPKSSIATSRLIVFDRKYISIGSLIIIGLGLGWGAIRHFGIESQRVQVQMQFRQAVAAMKVCTQGANYNEFHEKRLALETCFTANQSALNHEAAAFTELVRAMDATDILWDYKIQHSENPPFGFLLYHPSSSVWDAMLIISPTVQAKANLTAEQCERDRDFYAPNYIPKGLTMVSAQCDKLLADH
jgi:hypothetical protein